MFGALCTISRKRCFRVRIDTRDHSKINDRPPACSASATTTPLKPLTSVGRRTMMRVVYGAPLAVPETKYSSVTYGNASTDTALGTTLTGGLGYISAGPVIGPEIAGTGGTVDPLARVKPVRVLTTNATITIPRLHQ